MKTWRHGHGILTYYEKTNGNGSLDNFLSSVYRLFIMLQKFVICLFVDEETKGCYPFANGLNGLMDLPIYAYSFPSGKMIKLTEYNNHLFMLEA